MGERAVGERFVEQQARRLLWLFPGWLRTGRGEEALGVVLDLLPPGARRLPLRSRLDLVRAGLRARRHGTAPLFVWLGVVFARTDGAQGRIPPRWRPWLLWRLDSVRFRRLRIERWLVVSSMVLVSTALSDSRTMTGDRSVATVGNVVFALAVGGVVEAILGQRRRALLWRRQLLVVNALVERVSWEPAPGLRKADVGNWPARRLLLLLLGSGAVLLAVATEVLATHRGGRSLEVIHVGVAAVALGAILRMWWRLGHNATEVQPTAPAAPLDRTWASGTFLMGMGLPAGTLFLVRLGPESSGTIAGSALAAAVFLGAAVGLVQVVRVERRVGRRIGVWEVAPSLGPGRAPDPIEGPASRA